MKVALCHAYNYKQEYFILERDNITIEEVIRILGKLLHMESNIDVSSSIYCKEIAKILIEYFNFSSDLKEYQIKDIRKREKICEVNFRNIKKFKNEEIIYGIDLYSLWDEYVCSNYLELEKEVEENKDGLTSKLYKALYKAIITEKEEYYPNHIVKIKNSIKSEKLKKWFQEEENGEKI